MSYLSLQEARSRQTAYEATEHWWKSRLEQLRDNINECKSMTLSTEARDAFLSCADAIDALILERTR